MALEGVTEAGLHECVWLDVEDNLTMVLFCEEWKTKLGTVGFHYISCTYSGGFEFGCA